MMGIDSQPEGNIGSKSKPHSRFINIRSMLVLSFILVATVPLVIASIAASIVGSKSTETSAIKLLTTLLGYKEATLLDRVDALQVTIHAESIQGTERITAASLLSQAPKSTEWMNSYSDHMNQLIQSKGTVQGFDAYAILDNRGKVLFSNNSSLSGRDLAEEAFYQDALKGNRIYIGDLPNLGQNSLVLTEPVKDSQNQTIGYISGITSLNPLEEILLRGEQSGNTVESYLVGSDFSLLTRPNSEATLDENQQIYSKGSIDAILGNSSGAGAYENSIGQDVIGVYRWIPELRAALFVEQSRQEIYAPATTSIWINSAISLILIFSTILIGWYIANSIGKPIGELSQTAQQIAAGNVHLEAKVSNREDEVTILAESFNTMTRQLRGNISDLEKRITERTSDLESLTTQLLLASQLSSKVTSILDIHELFHQAVTLIREGFDLYYVGLFLIDETNSWAILKAGTGEEAHAMLKRGHRIKIGEGMIGWCIQNGRARIALQAGDDPIRLATPDLPKTRSEVAIPLRSRGLIIGALTIQSALPNAFDEASLTTFQTMADQIAVAIDNANLFAEAENSLAATQRAYGELSQKAWVDQLNAKPIFATRNEQGVVISKINSKPIDLPTSSSMGKDKSNGIQVIPIEVRGTVIGKIEAKKPEGNTAWTKEESEILNTLTEQLGIALDSARLFEETKTRAERDRLIGQITNRVRETLDIETILQTATIEIQKALGLDEVEVRMSQSVTQESENGIWKT
jgi:GAF domain-containing protein/HAMP domain-containing protein